MTQAIDIICESCNAKMRLSENLLSQIAGRSGRITCKRCERKVGLDATGDELRVTYGGKKARAKPVEGDADDDQAPISTSDPHLSEFPPGIKVAVAPPLSEELKERRRTRRLPTAHRVDFLGHAEAHEDLPAEAPEPPLDRGSLSPHTLAHDEEADDEDMVPMGREFQSSPYTTERDRTFQSLYADARRKVTDFAADADQSFRSNEVRAGGRSEIGRAGFDGTGADNSAGANDAARTEDAARTNNAARPGGARLDRTRVDGTRDEVTMADEDDRVAPRTAPLLTDAPVTSNSVIPPSRPQTRRGAWVPWAIAAVALFALGISLSLQLSGNRTLAGFEKKDPLPQLSTLSARPENVPLPIAPELVLASTLESDESGSSSSAQNSTVRSAPAPAATSSVRTSTPSADRSSSSDLRGTSGETKPVSASPDTSAPAEPAVEQPTVPPFSTAAASAALRDATNLAGGCRGADDPTGIARVQVTFAPSGRVTRATVSGPPYAGTPVGSCIASRFRSAEVPAFAGEHVTVSKTVTIR